MTAHFFGEKLHIDKAGAALFLTAPAIELIITETKPDTVKNLVLYLYVSSPCDGEGIDDRHLAIRCESVDNHLLIPKALRSDNTKSVRS